VTAPRTAPPPVDRAEETAGRGDAWTLGVVDAGELGFLPREVSRPGADGFVVATLYTGLPAGTELSFVKGTHPALTRRWDPERGVFDAGGPGTGFPVRRLCYMEVARVPESPSGTPPIGHVLAMQYGHPDGHTAAADELFVPLPADLDPVLGVFVAHMGPICANGLLHAAADEDPTADPHLGAVVRGRHVVVIGAGVVGLLTGLFARHLGAREVAVVDVTPERPEAAAALATGRVVAVDAALEVDAGEHAVHGGQ
jgi:hypothetical protein